MRRKWKEVIQIVLRNVLSEYVSDVDKRRVNKSESPNLEIFLDSKYVY